MIQAHEIRIGNRIFNKGREAIVSANTILAIAVWSKDYTPIPLTEDWLKRMGFIYHTGDFYSKNWGRNGVEIVKKHPDGWMFELGKGYLRHFEYVHQLQNLYFALTGTEIKITDLQ